MTDKYIIEFSQEEIKEMIVALTAAGAFNKPYIEKFWTGYKKWRNAIANASDDSADIYLSDFVDF